jgi:hypothetical protein
VKLKKEMKKARLIEKQLFDLEHDIAMLDFKKKVLSNLLFSNNFLSMDTKDAIKLSSRVLEIQENINLKNVERLMLLGEEQ